MGEMTRDELLKRREARALALKEEQERQELEELKLEDELSEKFGRRGRDFEIIATDVGVFAVRCPDFVVAKKFNAAKEHDEETIIHFVTPCLVYPEKAAFTAVIKSHAGVASRCCLALLAMHEASGVARAGKF